MRHRRRALATIEMGFLALLLVVVLLGIVSVAGIVQVEMGLAAVAEEAARAAAMAPSVALVQERGQNRGAAVGAGYALRNGSLSVTVDASRFAPGGRVRAIAAYRVTSADLPMLVAGTVDLDREHTEVVPRFRSLPP